MQTHGYDAASDNTSHINGWRRRLERHREQSLFISMMDLEVGLLGMGHILVIVFGVGWIFSAQILSTLLVSQR